MGKKDPSLDPFSFLSKKKGAVRKHLFYYPNFNYSVE